MLEVKNLTKIYKAKQKNGVDTYALNDVSLRFPDRGMVFLLGKSGSGKSTLLNVCGGLDAPTAGEIIVKGRSSKSFTQSDFDSYRNTFIGFIFQEYNILNEFTVEDNIALALELQGKPKDKKAIAELLKQVDLTGFAKRKPNTLSGGQKQRIAIARALVKSPEIIMADEPTGALDSATGKQVFDTLKKLSEDKLVIVVSHDREFAELYADRIIELKDGKILSDVTKTQEKQEAISENVTAIGDILCVNQGSELSDSDFERIKKIIKNNPGNIIIAGSDADVQNFKKINRITDKGEKEVFKETDESKVELKPTNPEDAKFIRSKLPARHAAKIGVSGLKTKPIRLFFTVLLCVVSFVLFGTLSTLMLYNSEAMFKETLKDSDHDFVVFSKVYYMEHSYYENGTLVDTYDGVGSAKFDSGDIATIDSAFGSGAFGAMEARGEISTRQSSSYWYNYFTSVAHMPEGSFLRDKIISGAYPTNDNEICISSYLAESLFESKVVDEKGSIISLTTYLDLVGESIIIGGSKYKVTGIFDSGAIDPKYDALKDNTNQDYSLEWDFQSLLTDGVQLLVAFSENGLELFAKNYSYMSGGFNETDYNKRGNVYLDNGNNDNVDDKKNDYNFGFGDGSFIQMGYSINYKSFSKLQGTEYVSLIGDFTTLSDTAAIIPFTTVYNEILTKLHEERNNISNYMNALYNAQYEINYLDGEIENVQMYIREINDEIARIKREMQHFPENSIEYQNYRIERDNAQTRLDEYRIQIQNYTASKNEVKKSLSENLGIIVNDINTSLEEYENKLKEIDKTTRSLDIINSGTEWIGTEDGELEEKIYTTEERAALLRELLNERPTLLDGFTVKFYLMNFATQSPLTEEASYTIAGIIIPASSRDYYTEDAIYFSDNVADNYWNTQKLTLSYSETTTNYKEEEGAKYTKLYVPYSHSDTETNFLWTIYNNEEFSENDTRMKIIGNYVSNLQLIDSFVVEFSSIFLYVGLVLAVFAILLFSNFITVSISQKRREIGILRAVGARSLDVFKIFFSESLVIAGICSVLSIMGSIVVCGVLNTELGAAIGASIFVFGIASILIILAIALLTAFLATFLPVYNAAKKKPVESIRAI